MKKNIVVVLAIAFLSILMFAFIHSSNYSKGNFSQKSIKTNAVVEFKEGDVLFQTLEFGQGKAIMIATKSDYSHCGMIIKRNNELLVIEAVEPVKYTKIDNWISRANGGKYVLKRLKSRDSLLTPTVISKMDSIGKEMIGKLYDLTFEWSDNKMYCSELVWKIYKRAANIELGKLQKLKDFDLSNPTVDKYIRLRYGKNPPLDETVISPQAIFESENLELVFKN